MSAGYLVGQAAWVLANKGPGVMEAPEIFSQVVGSATITDSMHPNQTTGNDLLSFSDESIWP